MAAQVKKVTRKDVAKRANVSETIVSYVVNENRYVDKEKKQRVLDAIKELKYIPNPIARSLKGKNSYHILFIADKIDNEHFGKIIREMDNFAYEKGYLISLIANRNDEEFLKNILARRVDGVIISSVSFKEEFIEAILNQNLPVVLLMVRDYEREFKGACKIFTGLYNGMKDGVVHLHSTGKDNLIYIDRISKRGNFSTMDDWRLRGFRDAHQELGLPFTMDKVVTGCETEEEVVEAVKKKLAKDKTINGIVGRNDHMALIAMQGVKETNLKIPNDIAVLGFDNSSISRHYTPSLTTVEIDRLSIAKNAVEMINAMLSGEDARDVSLLTKFIQRESV